LSLRIGIKKDKISPEERGRGGKKGRRMLNKNLKIKLKQKQERKTKGGGLLFQCFYFKPFHRKKKKNNSFE